MVLLSLFDALSVSIVICDSHRSNKAFSRTIFTIPQNANAKTLRDALNTDAKSVTKFEFRRINVALRSSKILLGRSMPFTSVYGFMFFFSPSVQYAVFSFILVL